MVSANAVHLFQEASGSALRCPRWPSLKGLCWLPEMHSGPPFESLISLVPIMESRMISVCLTRASERSPVAPAVRPNFDDRLRLSSFCVSMLGEGYGGEWAHSLPLKRQTCRSLFHGVMCYNRSQDREERAPGSGAAEQQCLGAFLNLKRSPLSSGQSGRAFLVSAAYCRHTPD